MTLTYDTLKQFERVISKYTGAPYVVLTDSCTHALELCMRYRNPGPVICSAYTYLSVPMMLHKIAVPFYWDHEPWEYEYRLAPSNIWDSARAFDEGMYCAGRLQCISFGPTKRLEIGHGGAILTNKEHEYVALKRMAYDGRDLDIKPWQDQKTFGIGYHYGMRLEDAQLGIQMMANNTLKEKYTQAVEYPDCSKLNIDKSSK